MVEIKLNATYEVINHEGPRVSVLLITIKNEKDIDLLRRIAALKGVSLYETSNAPLVKFARVKVAA